MKKAALLILAVTALTAVAAAPAKKLFWTGRSGGYTFTWTADDIQARGGKGGRVFSVVRPVREQALRVTREDKKTRREYHHHFTPLSVVGTLLSYEHGAGEDWEGEVHPFALTTYEVVDVAQPGRKIKLTDYFADRDVLAALLKDPVVREAMASIEMRSARSSQALIKRLADENADIQDGTYAIRDDQLSRFAFHHLEGNRVAVRLGISHGAEVSRGSLTQIGILLPIPARLKVPLQQAAARKSGFLMREQKQRFPEQAASFEFEFIPKK